MENDIVSEVEGVNGAIIVRFPGFSYQRAYRAVCVREHQAVVQIYDSHEVSVLIGYARVDVGRPVDVYDYLSVGMG